MAIADDRGPVAGQIYDIEDDHSGNGSDRKERAKMSWVTPEMLESPQFVKFREFFPDFQLENWRDPKVMQANRELSMRRSSILKEVVRAKQGWGFPEKVYVGDANYFNAAENPIDAVDRHIMQQPMCHSLLTRFDYVSGVLVPQYMRHFLDKKGSARVSSLGCGTGRDVIRGLKNFRHTDFVADLYDLDSSGFDVGRQLAEEAGLDGKVKFHKQDIFKLPTDTEPYDLNFMVGVVCPLTDRAVYNLMNRMRRRVVNPEEGILVTSASSDRMKTDDPLCRYLIESMSGWYLQFRGEGDLGKTSTEAGYTNLASTSEPTNYHRFIVGESHSNGKLEESLS